MLIPLMLSLAAAAPVPAASSLVKPPDPPVRVWLSDDGNYVYGDRARVYAQAAENGYLVVLHADVDGRVRVLFPVDPGDDHYVRGGKKYELKGRGDREAFVVDDTTGKGVIVAAYSKNRFLFEKFERNGHWDYRALSSDSVKADPEAALLDIVRAMQPDAKYSYDLASYVVSSPRYARYGRRGLPYPGRWPWYWDDWYGPRFGVGIIFGTPYYRRPYVYDPFYWGGWGRWRF